MAGKTKKKTGKQTPSSKQSSPSKKAPHPKKSPHVKKTSVSKNRIAVKADTQAEKHSGHTAVYIDVEFDRGLLYLVLVNDADLPAEQVSVKFDKPLYGVNGTDLSELGVFKYLAFLPPRKQIRIFLDDSQAYYAKRQRSVVKFELSWRIDKSRFTSTISHDMRAYADFIYVFDQPDNRRIGHVRS